MQTHDFSILLLTEILLEPPLEPFDFEVKNSIKGHITYSEVICASLRIMWTPGGELFMSSF